tara:strand:+ start:7905 stop:10040 length:2136 start_codon:yes stop_codon:yes gene_type:complete
MSDLIIFRPKSEIDAEQNLKDFIEFSQKLPPLNEEMEYKTAYWKRSANFIKFGVSSRNRDKINQLDQSIMPFSKAYLTYSQTQNTTKNPNEIKALRGLEAAMMKSHGTVEITQINSAVLDNAAQLVREALKGSAYHGGSHLEKLQKFLVKKHIIPKFTWINPIKRAPDVVDKVGEEGKANREKKLPDEDALMALSEIFNLGESSLCERDIFTTSGMPILLCAPARGSELFYLKTDCLHYDKDTKGNPAVGFNWYSGKGYGHEVEWIPDVMVPVAEKAVARINAMSKTARVWAEKMEQVVEAVDSGKTPLFPRHENCPDVVSDYTLLTLVQTANAMGYAKSSEGELESKSYVDNARAFLKKRGVFEKGWKANDKKYCLHDLIPKLIERLPKGFPYVPYEKGEDVKVKWSQALFCLHANELDTKKKTIVTELWMPDINTLNEDLAITKKRHKKGELAKIRSVFERHNYPSSYSLSSHQLRHMLSTIGKVNGMQDQVLSKWAARADEKHNRVYNHKTPQQYKETAALIQHHKNSANDLGLREFEISTPETLQEINSRSVQTAHVTEFGACVHDYIMSPCSKHRDCINCEEQMCVKGDEVKLARLNKRLEREKMLIEGDKNAVEDGLLNADRHYQKRLITIRRCEELIEILSDENVPDGSVVKLSMTSVSHLDQVMDKNHKKRLPKIEKHKKEQSSISTKKPRALANYKRNRRYN